MKTVIGTLAYSKAARKRWRKQRKMGIKSGHLVSLKNLKRKNRSALTKKQWKKQRTAVTRNVNHLVSITIKPTTEKVIRDAIEVLTDAGVMSRAEAYDYLLKYLKRFD